MLFIVLLCGPGIGQPPAGVSDARPAADSSSPPASLNDLWDDKAAWVPDAQKVGGAFSFHYLSLVRERDEVWAYYIHNHAGTDGKFKQAIGRARSRDGLEWTDDGMVLDVGPPGAWDDRIASYPGIWKDGDTWYLVYEGAAENIGFSPGEIGLATSKDGKSFVKHPNNPVLRRDARAESFERVNIGTPSLYREDGTWYLFYHGYDGNVCQIAVASGGDLTKLKKSSANPIIPVTAGDAAWDTGTTGKRSSIVKDGEYYYLAFEGSTLPPFPTARWSSGLARTKKLTDRWTKLPSNPMLLPTGGSFGHDGPELLKHDGQWFLYVRTPATNATDRFRLEAKR
jgi:beta-xylosidase